MERVLLISVNELHESPYQGRLINVGSSENEKNELDSLKRSIKANGLMNPVIARAIETGYELVDGHRRVEAYKQLGIDKIACFVKNYTDSEAQVMSVVGNLQREDLSNIEKAIAFKKVLDHGIFKDKRDLSKAIGKDETYVGDLLNTVNMDQRIIDDLLKNKTTNDVRLLRTIRTVDKVDETQKSDKQWQLYQRFLAEGLSRFDVQNLVKNLKDKPEKLYSVNLSAQKIHISFHEKLPKNKRDLITKLLEEKMDEIMNSL